MVVVLNNWLILSLQCHFGVRKLTHILEFSNLGDHNKNMKNIFILQKFHWVLK